MLHSLASSKPNLKRKLHKNSLNQPESKKSKELVKDLDDDDILLSQVNLEEIEFNATQVQAQQEHIFIKERFERNHSSDSYTKQVIELKKSHDVKAGEALVLRDKLAQVEKKVIYVEQQLANEKLEKCSREKEKQKREISFKLQIEKCEEKFSDQLSFKNQELEVASIKIKNLIAENKSLILKVNSQWDQMNSQTLVPVSSFRNSIKVTRPEVPKSKDTKNKSLISTFGQLSTNKKSYLLQKFQFVDKKISKNKIARLKEVSQNFDLSLNTILDQCPSNSSLCRKAQQAKPIGKLLLNILNNNLVNCNLVMACNSFCDFFNMYLTIFCDCSLYKSNKSVMEAVLKLFEFLLKNFAYFPELMSRNYVQILPALFSLCRISSMKTYVFKVLETILYKLDNKVIKNFLPLFTDARIPLPSEIAYCCKFVLKNIKASENLQILGKNFIKEAQGNKVLENSSNEMHFLTILKNYYERSKVQPEAYKKNVFTKTGAIIHFILKEMGDDLTENLVLLEEIEKIFCCMLQELKNKESCGFVDFLEIFQFIPRDLMTREPLLVIDFERRKKYL